MKKLTIANILVYIFGVSHFRIQGIQMCKSTMKKGEMCVYFVYSGGELQFYY